MNIASIDIGSNTVLLLIAEIEESTKYFKVIINRYEAPRLGKGLKSNGNISDESITKLLNVLISYRKIIDEYKCKIIICTATNAMRVANNSKEIVSKIKTELDIDIEIITGDKEAELSFLGASTVLPGVENKMVMDIGGGSTEIILGNDNEIFYKKSFPCGAVNLTEEFIHNEIPTKVEIESLEKFIRKSFSELLSIVTPSIPLIAVAGTPTSLSAANLGLRDYEESIVEGSVLTINDLEIFLLEFSSLSPSDILNKYGNILRGREDVILAGTLILKTVSELTTNKKIFVSGRGIRYGSVIEFIRNNF